MAESEPFKSKPRPIIRLGLFLISHSFIFSALCCTAGVVALFLLPILAKNTYISENALMPGSASPMLTADDVSRAYNFVKEVTDLSLKSSNSGTGIPGLVAEHMTSLGGEVNYHKFFPQVNRFHPLRFFTSLNNEIGQLNDSCSSLGVNTVGIIRSPRSDGKEAIVLVTPYNSRKTTLGEALSLGIAYSVFSLLTRVTWLAKDIIWLAADSHYGEYASVSAWLRDYHRPVFVSTEKLNGQVCSQSRLYDLKTKLNSGVEISDSFQRAGTMAAALVIKVADRIKEADKDALRIYAEASNGQMPNLDLINVVNYLAVHGQGLRVKVDRLWSLINSKWLHSLGDLFETVGQIVRSINPGLKFGIPGVEYVEGTATLASSLYNQALGVPTGSHGAFRDYQVDAITMEISPRISSNFKDRRSDFLLRSGRLVEGVVRSVNNLLEKFHQSFFLFLLTSSSRFVSVGVYMIAFMLLVAPLPMVAASLYLYANKLHLGSEKDELASSSAAEPAVSFSSWKWIQAAKRVFVVHLWGAIVALLPYFICQIPNCSSTNSIVIWIVLSMLILLILQSISFSPAWSDCLTHPQGKGWPHLKAVMIAAAFIGLCLMSVINFATAEIGALLIVPMCLMVKPLTLDFEVLTPRASAWVACNIFLLLTGFPIASFLVLKAAFGDGFSNFGVSSFWNWIESLWEWSSASYIYICMVHLPCWALCIHVFLHRC